jgi:hypothetical protein
MMSSLISSHIKLNQLITNAQVNLGLHVHLQEICDRVEDLNRKAAKPNKQYNLGLISGYTWATCHGRWTAISCDDSLASTAKLRMRGSCMTEKLGIQEGLAS